MHPDDKRVLDLIAEGINDLHDLYPTWSLPVSLSGVGAMAVWEKLAEAGVQFKLPALIDGDAGG